MALRGVEFVENDINLNVLEFIFGINLLNLEEMLLEERKRKRRCEFDCTDHIFMLQALKSNPSKYDIQLQFCPKYQRQPLPPQRTYPEFNDDFLYYTSAFVLGVDKRVLIKNQQQELMDHQKQIRDAMQKHNQLVFPRPNSKHSLCSVCKEHYKNYYIHIASEEHRIKIGLSSYNTHIKDLCYQYIHLWQGAQQRADEQAEKRAIEEQQRRQRLAEQKLQQQHQQEQSNSLLDCQRGQQQEQQQEQEQEFMSRAKNHRKSEKSVYNNEDTVPLNGKNYKRSAPDKSLYQPPIRKRYTAGQFNPTHAARERKERQYQRQRDKMMRGTQFQFFKRHYKPRPGLEDDVFIVMQPIEGQNQVLHQHPRAIQTQKTKKTVVQERKTKSEVQKVQNEFYKSKQTVIKQTETLQDRKKESKKQKQIHRDWNKQSLQAEKENKDSNIKQQEVNKISPEEGELSHSESQSFSNSSNSEFKDNMTIKKHPTNKRQEYPQSKIDPRMQGYPYHYPPMPMHTPHYPHKNQQLTPEQYNQAYKGAYNQYAQHYKNYSEGHKGMPPYYYNPYSYPMYNHFYMRPPNEKVFQANSDKQKNKVHQKPYDYPMPYHWPYHPYYMPPMPPIPPISQQKTDHIPSSSKNSTNVKSGGGRDHSSNPYSGNTNININYPIYMFPPHPSMPGYSLPPNRYPPAHPMMNPYMGYPYNPYTNQQERSERQRETPPSHQAQNKDPRFHSNGYPNYPPHNGGYQANNANQNGANRPHNYNYPYPPYHQYPPHLRQQQKTVNKQV